MREEPGYEARDYICMTEPMKLLVSYVVIVLLFQLLCVSPAPNVLSLVYRDQDSLRFNKYLNHRATDSSESSFFAIAMVYKESNVGTNLETQWMLPVFEL